MEKSYFEEDRAKEIKAKADGKIIDKNAFVIYNKSSLLKNLAQKFKEEEETDYTKEDKEYLTEEIKTMLNEIKGSFEEILKLK